jgi:predicted CXXCH cytochrome family protein
MRLKLILLIIFAVLLTAGISFASDACFQCHKKSSFQKKIVHQPLSKGQCIACHNPHVAPHKGLLKENVKDLCFSCHKKQEKSFSTGVVHTPVRRGQCAACHDSHSSNLKGLLKKSLGATCFECHTKLKKKYKNIHEPFEKGQCDACHWSHQADNYQLLKSEPVKLCRSCHGETDIGAAHKNFPVKVNKDCLSCHNPHGSMNKAMIRDVIHQPFKKSCKECHSGATASISQEKCLECHAEIKEGIYSSHSHLTDRDGNSCTNCHSPHAGDTKSLLKQRQSVICRECHEDTFKRHESSRFVHKATAGRCSVCHAIHGADQVALLKGDGNKVCLPCHASQGQFSHPVGKDVPDPRNSQMTTCVSCHDPHGSDFKGHLKLSGQQDLCVQCHRM